MRAFCYIIRVFSSIFHKTKILNIHKHPLIVAEIAYSEKICVKVVQHDYYNALYWHIHYLNGKSCVSVKKEFRASFSALKKFLVFFQDGILRIHSRIVNSNMTYDKRFPILLPRRHHFVEMLVRQYHINANHFGWSYVLSRIQDKYWIV